MGKGSAPDSPDPQALIKAQTDANRVNQYTPYGNLQYGNFDENGNFVPNSERESAIQTQRPQDQQFQNYSDAGRAALFQSIFGNYNAPANSSATGTNSSSTGTTAGGETSLAATMAKPATTTDSRYPQVKPYAGPGVKGYNAYGQGADNPFAPRQTAENTVATSAPPNPYGSNTQGGGIGSFSGFNLNSAGDPNAIRSGLSANWGNPNSLKSGLSDFYNLNGIKGGLPSVSSDFSADRQKAEDAAYNRAVSKFEPDFQQRQRQLEQRLADTGNVMGSEGYNTEMDRFNRMQNEAYTNAGYDAVNAGTNMYDTMQRLALGTRGQLFGEDTSLAGLTAQQRAQQFGENQSVFDAQNRLRQLQLAEGLGLFNADNSARSNQLNEMTSLLGMQSPQASFVNAPEVPAASIMNQDYQNRLNAYNSQTNGLGSLLGVGGTILGGGLNPGWLSALLA